MRRIAAALVACAILISCVPLDGIESKEEIQMTRPTSLPEWASSPPVGAIVEPSAGKKQAGHAPAERPPAEYENWWKNLAYQHLEYLDQALHAEQEHWITAADFTPVLDSGETIEELYRSGGEWWSSDTFPYEVHVPLRMLRVGDRIKSITVYGVAGDAGGEILEAEILRRNGATGSATAVSTSKTSAATSGQANLAWTTADTDFSPDGYEVLAGGYYLKCLVPTTSSAGEVRYYAVKVVFDRPSLD